MQVVGCIARFIALGCAILFVITTLLALTLFNIDQQLLNAGSYKRALAQERIYERFPSLAAELAWRMSAYNPCVENPGLERCKLEEPSPPNEHLLFPVYKSPSPGLKNCLIRALGENAYATLANGKRQATSAEIEPTRLCMRQFGVPDSLVSGKSGPPLYTWMLDRSDLEAILSALLPTAVLQTLTENFLDQFFDYLDAKTDAVKISLVEFKARLTGDAGMTILLRLLRAQPPCTKEQLTRLTGIGASTEIDKMLACRPPEETLTKIAPQIQTAARSAIAKLPDEAVLPLPSRREIANSSSKAEGPEGVIKMLPLIRLILRTSPLLPLGLLLTITLFGVRSFKGLLLWWGVPFLAVGIIGGGFAVIAYLIMDWSMARLVPADSALVMGFTSNAMQAAKDVGRDIFRAPAIWIGVEAGIIGLLGFAFLLALLFINGKRPGFAETRVAAR